MAFGCWKPRRGGCDLVGRLVAMGAGALVAFPPTMARVLLLAAQNAGIRGSGVLLVTVCDLFAVARRRADHRRFGPVANFLLAPCGSACLRRRRPLATHFGGAWAVALSHMGCTCCCGCCCSGNWQCGRPASLSQIVAALQTACTYCELVTVVGLIGITMTDVALALVDSAPPPVALVDPLSDVVVTEEDEDQDPRAGRAEAVVEGPPAEPLSTEPLASQ